MAEKHKYCDLIVAWANGARIQILLSNYSTLQQEWYDCDNGLNPPLWHSAFQYRIKPETKPDIKVYASLRLDEFAGEPKIVLGLLSKNNVIISFDGETDKLKSVEVIK